MRVMLLEVERELTWEECKTYAKLLSVDRQEKSLKYINDEKKIISLLSSLLIQYVVDKGTKIEYTYNQYGKPYLVNMEDVYFSISHSGKYIAMIKDTEEVGIDIEEINSFNIKVAQKFFTKEENNFLIQQNNNISIEGYRIWTQKEAYLKKVGTGFANGGYKLNTLDPNIRQHIKTIQIENYMLTIATEEINPEIKLERITSKELLNKID